MVRLFYILTFIFGLSTYSSAQKFNVSEVDARSYPKVNANFSAFNQVGEYYTNLETSHFSVNENGLDLPAESLELFCTSELPVNVVLVLDRSSSMNEKYNGETLWDWTVEGARTFIENFPFNDSAKVAIIAFAGSVRLTCDFTNNKKELLDSIKKIPDAYGATNYNMPMLTPDIGAIDLLKTRPAYHRRAIVFLTDGLHESTVLRDKEIVASLIENNVRFYGITLMVGISGDLQNWAAETAGKYSFVASKIGLSNIYKDFAQDLKGTVQCQLRWLSPDICDLSEIYRQTKITFKLLPETVTRNYVAPLDTKVEISTDKEMYIFGDPPIGQTKDMEIIITPKVKQVKVQDISIIPNTYFEIIDWGDGIGVQPSYDFLMPVDVPRKIVVRFKPMDIKKIRQATLLVSGLPCPLEIPLFGGFQQIVLDQPTNIKVVSRCDTIDIAWSGISQSTLVDLLYSTDGGSKWTVIKSKLSGNKYTWAPGFSATNVLVKVRISEQFSYEFVNSLGSDGSEVATTVAVTKNGHNHFVSGYFTGKTQLGNTVKNSSGKEDFFLAKFDIEGNPIWLKTGGSPGYDDRANGVTVDVRGNAFITGFTYQGYQIDAFQPVLDFQNSKYLFLAKISPAGQYNATTFLGATPSYPDFQAEGIKIKTQSAIGEQNKIVIIGKYKGYYFDSKLSAVLPYRDTDTTFTVVFDEYLNVINMYVGIKDFMGYADTTYTDFQTLTKYGIGNFFGTTSVQGVSLNSKGKSDYWVYKYAKNPSSDDVSSDFEIARPMASFSMSLYNFGSVVYGDEVTQTATGLLVNTGKLPYSITGYTIRDIAGKDVPDFDIKTAIIGTTLQPGESIDLELWFKPGYLSVRTAILTLSADCALDITLDLKGDGACGGVAPELYDFGDVNLNKQKFDTIICSYQNVSQTATVINPQLRGPNYGDFFLIIPDYVKPKMVAGKITVAPGECIDLIVRFEPKSIGLREADLNFFVASPCKNSITKLIGNGISADIGVTSFNWRERRINGTYSGEIEIINNSNGVEIVDNIQFENAVGTGIFEFENVKIPFNLPPNGSVKLNVTFKPVAEIEYIENLLVFVESKQDPLLSNLMGIGILPKLVTTVSCGESVKVGETTLASIVLKNPSTSADLKLKSILIEGNDEFVFPAGTLTTDLVIPMDGEILFPVLYTPISGGDNSDNFIILADDYDGTFAQEWKEARVQINCDGVEVDVTPAVDFGAKIVCSTKSLPITILNKSKDTDVTIKLSEMFLADGSSSDYSQFSLPVLNDITLKGGQSITFDVIFNPQIKGNFDLNLFIPNSIQTPFKIAISGSSVGINLSTNIKEITVQTADKFRFSLIADLPKVESGKITSLKVSFNTDPSLIAVVNNSFKSTAPTGWTWGNLTYLGSGYYEITGNGELADNMKTELFSVEFLSYLNDKNRTQIFAEVDYGCAKDNFELTIINIEEVCFNDNRIIELQSTAKFGITSPNPNPANQSVNLNYGVGFDTFTNIEIVNSFGEIVRVIYNGMHKSGEYSLSIPTNELSSGSYYIRMSSGPFFETKPILIVK